jgi:hypothetical protein
LPPFLYTPYNNIIAREMYSMKSVFINALCLFFVTQLNSNNINIPINVDTNTFTITEYFRYSTYGKICIIDFGGIISNKSGRSILLSNEIPKPITRTVCVLTDADAPITQSPIIAVSHNKINTKELRIHIRNDAVKKALYGQMFYFI